MALIIAILLGICLWLYCANDKAKRMKQQRDYIDDHPACRCQEEYLLTSELYHKYKTDGNHQSPKEDAVYNAGWEIIKIGSVPRKFKTSGLNIARQSLWEYKKHADDIDDPPQMQVLSKYRDEDAMYLRPTLVNEGYVNPAGWKAYCDQIDSRFEMDVLHSLIDYGIIDGAIHESPSFVYDASTNTWVSSGDVQQTLINYDVATTYGETMISYLRMEWQVIDQIIKKHQDELPEMIHKRNLD